MHLPHTTCMALVCPFGLIESLHASKPFVFSLFGEKYRETGKRSGNYNSLLTFHVPIDIHGIMNKPRVFFAIFLAKFPHCIGPNVYTHMDIVCMHENRHNEHCCRELAKPRKLTVLFLPSFLTIYMVAIHFYCSNYMHVHSMVYA